MRSMSAGEDKHWKVGELASATGLTVRTLHHYDGIGLLVPSQRTFAGHRRYAEPEVQRLYRILAWRRLGLGLEEIGTLLDEGGVSLVETVRRHLGQVERELEQQHGLREQLRRMLDALERSVEPSVDEYIDALEAMTMIEAVVDDVVIMDLEREQRLVLLKERSGDRVLPIFVGAPEGDALVYQRSGLSTPRPLGPDLTAALLQAGGVQVERVVIESLRDNTYFATVVVADGDSNEVDARPSDALNLASRLGVPVFVASEVMDHAGMDSKAALESWPGPGVTGAPALAGVSAEWQSVTPELIRSLHVRRSAAMRERRMTEPARLAMERAQEEARALAHDRVAPEHILLGLLRDEQSVAAQVLGSLNITAERVREQALRLERASGAITTEPLPPSPRAGLMLEWSCYGSGDIGPEQLLLGLAFAKDSVLVDFGVEAGRVRDEVHRRLGAPPTGDARSSA